MQTKYNPSDGTKKYCIGKVNDSLAVVSVGGKDPSKSLPNANISFKLNTSKEQYWFNINRPSVKVSGISSEIENKAVELKSGNEKDIWYIDENGRFKWDIEFTEKPDTNVFEWEILAHGDINFYYQAPIEDLLKSCNPDSDEYKFFKNSTQEELVAGSYAVYVNKAGTHYIDGEKVQHKTGKLCHIYRPFCIDSKNENSIADISIQKVSENRYSLKITIDQNYIDTCAYPMVLDPIIGYDVQGASYVNDLSDKYIVDYNTTATESGTIESVSAYVGIADICKLCVCDDRSDGNILIDTGEITADSARLATLDVSSLGVQVTSGSDYYAGVCVPQDVSYGVFYDTGVVGSGGSPYSPATYSSEYGSTFGVTSENTAITISAWLETAPSEFTITELPVDFQGVLDPNNQIDLSISGTIASVTGSMQSRVLVRGTDEVIQDWTNLSDSSTPSGSWSGNITGISKTNALLYYEVRDSGDTGTVVSSTRDFGTAYHFPTGGQSNMDYMFVHGTGTPNALTYKIDDATGVLKTMTGQGAITLANALQSLMGAPIVLYDFAVGGSALIEANEITTGWWLTTSGDAKSANYTALETAVDNYTGGVIHGLLWFQGETEATAGESAIDMQTNEALFFAQVRSDFTNALAGVLPIFSCLLNRWLDASATDEDWSNTNAGKIANCKADDNAYYVSGVELPMRDDYHLSDTSYGTLGTRLAQKILDVFGFVTYSDHPEIIGYSIVDSVTTDFKLLLSSGATDYTPASGFTGLRVLLDGVLTTPTVVRSDSTTIRAYHTSGVVTGGDYLWGTNPPFAGIIKDNSALALPVIQNYDIAEYVLPSPQPAVEILSPTTSPTYITEESTIDISGTSSISSGSVISVTWSNSAGGSGVCAGTSTWSQSNIALAEGENTLTVTAESDLGETDSDTLTVTFTPPDPSVTITSPTSSETYETSSSNITLGGSASISAGTIESVIWSDNLGGSGLCSGTSSWTVSILGIAEGVTEFTITATSSLGKTSSDLIIVTYIPGAEIGSINLTGNWPGDASVLIDGTTYTSNTDISITPGSYSCVPSDVDEYTTPDSQIATVVNGESTAVSFIWVSETIETAFKKTFNPIQGNITRFSQTENSECRYNGNWGPLIQTKTITDSSWTLEGGNAEVSSELFSETKTSCIITGDPGEHNIINKISLSDGQVFEHKISLRIDSNSYNYFLGDYS